MRIISGKYRGMKLSEFDGENIRPTSDRVKESLFNILFSEIGSSRVLDLFCGSGNVGIECLSRGASFVHFNDVSLSSVSVLKKNVSRLKETNYKITNLDFAECLANVKEFDFIFLDPPYRLNAGTEALEIIGKREILSLDGVAVLERDVPFTGEITGLEKFDERRYGKTYLTFFKRKL